MIRQIDSIMLSTENAKELAKFYHEVVGFEIEDEYEGENGEYGVGLSISDGPNIFINSHSEVSGKNSDPSRFLINFEVDNIEKESERIEKNGAKVIKEIYHVEGYGLVATYEDTDGNYFQLVQVRES